MQPISPDVLKELTEWRRRGGELRAKLEKERDALRGQLQTVEAALAELPSVTMRPVTPAPPATPPPNLSKASAPEIVRAILIANPAGLTSSPIIEQARKVRPDLTAENLHSAIFRLKEAGTVEVQGERPNRIYKLAKTSNGMEVRQPSIL